jgi:hypothetical protein
MKTSQKVITLIAVLVVIALVILALTKKEVVVPQEMPLVPKDHMETLSTGATLLVPGYIMFIKVDFGESFQDMSDSVSSQWDIAFTRVEFHKGDKLLCESFTFERCTKYRSGVLGVTKGTGQGKKFYDYLVKEGVYKK